MLRELLVYDGHQVCSLRKEQYSVGIQACLHALDSATARQALAHCT